MPEKRLPRVYDVHDWKKADRIGRILINLIDPDSFPLNARDEKYFTRIRRCFTIVKSTFSEVSIYAMLKSEFPSMNSRQLSELKADTNRFYDHFDIESRKIHWLKQNERIMKGLELAYEEKDIQSIAKLEAVAQKMRAEIPEDLIDQEDNEMPDFVFTTDDKYLDIEATEYTEIDEEE